MLEAHLPGSQVAILWTGIVIALGSWPAFGYFKSPSRFEMTAMLSALHHYRAFRLLAFRRAHTHSTVGEKKANALCFPPAHARG